MSHLLVVVPFTKKGLHPEVLEALRPLPMGATLAPWELKDEAYGYGRMLRAVWQKCAETRTDLCIVEQDNLVQPFINKHDSETGGTIAGFIACPDWWCAHSYEVAPRPDVRGPRGQSRDIATAYGGPYGLGCVRFRWQLMAAEPDVLTVALQRAEHPGFPAGHYIGLDSAVTGILRGRIDQRTGQRDDGFTRAPRYDAHQHFPNVGHLHRYTEPVGHAAPV